MKLSEFLVFFTLFTPRGDVYLHNQEVIIIDVMKETITEIMPTDYLIAKIMLLEDML